MRAFYYAAGCIEFINEKGDMDYYCSGTMNPEDCMCSCILENNPGSPSGVYRIKITGIDLPFAVYCDMESDGGGWTTFQLRYDGSVDFVTNSDDEYIEGFGSATKGEYWLGLERLLVLLNRDQQNRNELRIDIEDWEGEHVYSTYHDFHLEMPGYKLVAQYDASKSTAGDGFDKYQDYGDEFRAYCNKPDSVGGGHWKSDSCDSYANLNGRYYETDDGFYYDVSETDWIDGVVWPTGWHADRPEGVCGTCAQYYSLKKTQMKIRNLHV